MGKSKIYITANDRAKVVAEMLRDGLRQYCSADVWEDVDNLGLTKIETLERLVNEYDFAVIILAKDDLVVAKGLEKEESLKTRGDCLLEAGFFMSAIGRERCFLVSSVEVDKKDLPSDFEGIIPVNFEEPTDLNSRKACKSVIQSASARIKDKVEEIRKEASRRRLASTIPLSRNALLEMEQLEPAGHLGEDQVVVASVRPRDLDYATAARLRDNIDRNVSYVYFCEGNKDAAFRIPQMLQLVLLAPFLKLKPEDADNFEKRLQLVKGRKTEILEDLKKICSDNKLNIYFLSEPPDVQYRIHNAGNVNGTAKLYMERSGEYIEFESGEMASDFWTRIIDTKCAKDPLARGVLFHGGPHFDLKGEPFYTILRQKMLYYFPEIGEEALELCLVGP